MTSKKYPLDPLVKVRAQAVDTATRALAESIRAREAAERRERVAEDEKRRAEEDACALREAERAKLEQGELKVVDLMRADAWGVAVEAEHERLEQQVQRASEEVRQACAGEGAARAGVASRKAEAEIVEKDRAKWQGRVRREADARQEEEAAEVWRPKRG